MTESVKQESFFDLPVMKVPFNTIPDVHYGYLLKDTSSGHFKVGITSDLERRLKNYRTHNRNLFVAYVEAFPSKKWASSWEKRVMFVAGSRSEWIGPIGEWLLFISSGYGRHVGTEMGQFISGCGNVVDDLNASLMSRNGPAKSQLDSLLRQLA